jgi:hypothetical protein
MAYRQDYPFEYIKVDRILRGNSVIHWALDPEFDESTPWTYTLQWASSGDNAWTDVTTVSDQTYATDTEQREKRLIFEGAYRLKLVTGDGTIYYSKPSLLPLGWTSRDLRIAEEIKRKEELVYGINGVTFWLLQRKWWGSSCSDCVDDVSGEVLNTNCTSCFGTGYEGGYYTPYEMKGMYLTPKQAGIKQSNIGTVGQDVVLIRCCPLPVVHKDDIIIASGSDQRYIIPEGGVKTVSSMKNIPLVQVLTCALLPPSDIVYSMSWPTGSLSTGPAWVSPTGATASNWE